MFGDAVGLMYSLKTPTINQSIPTGQPCGASSIPQDFGAWNFREFYDGFLSFWESS